MSRTHVWLLGFGEPLGDPRAWLQQVYADPSLHPLPMAWLRPWYVKLMCWLLASRLALPGPEGDQDRATTMLAEELGRLLGSRYQCTFATAYGEPSIERALRWLNRRERVILLPLVPHAAGAGAAAALSAAERAIAGQAAGLIRVQPPADDPGVIEALAETVREGILALSEPVSYGLLFCAQQAGRRDPALLLEVPRLAKLVSAEVGTEQPWAVGLLPAPGLRKVDGPGLMDAAARLREQGVQRLVVVPVARVSDIDQALSALPGFTEVVRAPELGARPTFVRALIGLVRATEERAGWAESRS